MPRIRIRSIVPVALVASLAIPQSGCLTNYMWESRLVTAGEHHEGRMKFSGDLRDAKFDSAGNLALPGTMAYADGKTASGALVLPPYQVRELDAMLRGESADDIAWVSFVRREPSYGIGMEPVSEPERSDAAKATFDKTLSRESLASRGYWNRCRLMRQWVGRNATPDAEAFDARYRDPELCNPGIEITYDTLRYDPDYDGVDTASKVILTPFTAAVDVAMSAVGVGVAIAFVPISIPLALLMHDRAPVPPAESEKGRYRPSFRLIPDGPETEHWTGFSDYEKARSK